MNPKRLTSDVVLKSIAPGSSCILYLVITIPENTTNPYLIYVENLHIQNGCIIFALVSFCWRMIMQAVSFFVCRKQLNAYNDAKLLNPTHLPSNFEYFLAICCYL
jgi:hypothetical protein